MVTYRSCLGSQQKVLKQSCFAALCMTVRRLSKQLHQIDILNPKATRLLKDLADMDLIAIKETNSDGFMQVVEQLRSKAQLLQLPTIEEITEEVEAVRAERCASRKG